MVQWVEGLVIKPEDLSWIPRTHSGRRKCFYRLSSEFHVSGVYAFPPTPNVK